MKNIAMSSIEPDFVKNPVTILEKTVNQENLCPPHWHSEVHFALVTRGTVSFQVEDKDYTLEEGKALFINAHSIHIAHTKSPLEDAGYLSVKFHPSVLFGQLDLALWNNFVGTILNAKQLSAVAFTNKEKAGQVLLLLDKLKTIYEKNSYDQELNIRIILLQLWQELFERVRPSLEMCTSGSYSDSERGNILQAYIYKNYAEKITLEDLSRSAHISRSECCRIFKRLYHTTPFQYLLSFRLSQSLPLLCESNSTISEIAQQVGFGSSSYYTECFKKEMHCTPLKYRQKYQRAVPKMPCAM